MDKYTKKEIEKRIKLTTRIQFEELIDLIFQEKYGLNYTPVKSAQDKGCDGIIEDETGNGVILAVYGPDPTNNPLSRFKDKLKKDYQSYIENWVNKYNFWMVVYNNEFTADRILFLDSLCPTAKKVGVKELVSIICSLFYPKQRKIALYLGIELELFRNYVFIQVLEEMKNRGVRLIATSQGIDTSTAEGTFFYTILSGVAQLEREMIKSRVLSECRRQDCSLMTTAPRPLRRLYLCCN